MGERMKVYLVRTAGLPSEAYRSQGLFVVAAKNNTQARRLVYKRTIAEIRFAQLIPGTEYQGLIPRILTDLSVVL